MYKWCNSGFLCLYWLIQMPESQHGLVRVVCCSDLWALWVIVRHAGRGYGFIILWTTSLLTTGMNLAFLSSHCSLYFCPELSVSNYSKSCSIDFKTVLKEASWKVLMQTHLKASFFVVVVCVEPAVTGLVATCWSQAARSLCWATPEQRLLIFYSLKPDVGWAGLRKIAKLLSFVCAGPVWHRCSSGQFKSSKYGL